MAAVTPQPTTPQPARTQPSGPALDVQDLNVYYGDFHAVRGITMSIKRNEITAFIGPSGCGKSTALRSFNRTNDLVPGARVQGRVLMHGEDLYGPEVDPIEVRRRVGMVFQKPNPFPKSIFDNVAYGPRVNGWKLKKAEERDMVEQALTRAGLWNEVKHKLNQSGLALSGGQQQRLCIARAIANNPEILLMDEPAASLDPISTALIEDLMAELVTEYTVVIVTHNMQQAGRVSNTTAFFTAEVEENGTRYGTLVEMGPTSDMFTHPVDPRTEDYISGRFG